MLKIKDLGQEELDKISNPVVTKRTEATPESRRREILSLLSYHGTVGPKDQLLLAHELITCAGWDVIHSVVNKECNYLFTSGWLNSVFRNSPINADGKPIPWYTYPALEFIDRIDWSNASVFELGCGMSTLWWTPRSESVIAVEHNPYFHQIVQEQLGDRAKVFLRESKDGYVNLIKELDRKYDVIVIDGEWRKECVPFVVDYLNDDGLLIFDNTDRLIYDEHVNMLSERMRFRMDFHGLIPVYYYKSCTSMFFNSEKYLKPRNPSRVPPTMGQSTAQFLNE